MRSPAVNLDLDLMRTFLAIVDCGGFTSATQRIHRTQSTVSLHLRRLEELTGKRLIERNGRSVRLTDDGELLRTYARNIIALNDEAYQRVKSPKLVGAVRIGMPQDFAAHQLAGILHRFAKAHPDVRLDVKCALSSELYVGMANEEFDLCIARREDGNAAGESLWREPLQWVVANDSNLHRSDLIPLVTFPERCPFRSHVVSQLERASRPWKIVYTSTSLAGVQAAVQAGLGVSVLAKSTVPEGVQVLGRRDGLPALSDTETALFRPRRTTSAAVESLASFILTTRQRLSKISLAAS